MFQLRKVVANVIAVQRTVRMMSAIRGLDHAVVHLKKKETLDQWADLGLKPATFGANNDRYYIQVGQQKLNIHLHGHDIFPRADQPEYGSADLCFEVEDLAGMQKKMEALGYTIEEGPVARTGARAPFTSIYWRDPEGNLLEFSEYPKDSPLASGAKASDELAFEDDDFASRHPAVGSAMVFGVALGAAFAAMGAMEAIATM